MAISSSVHNYFIPIKDKVHYLTPNKTTKTVDFSKLKAFADNKINVT